ncbi:hypothetical protein L3X38_030080 [Prunus dulcis]|uniref:RNase H type-1 domain-containing protein n=1 Tax=Prunus dulcis TaxID=3755 RepID=A0AAD4URI8_PRUDU|nr:hypothetical protein L3X38_030080 [Prunus dulcis]
MENPFGAQTDSESGSAKSYALMTARGPQNCIESLHHPRPRAATRAGRSGVQSDYGSSKNLETKTPNSCPRKPTRFLTALSWQYPNEGVIKINTDGCRKGEDGHITARGVLRDSSGQWMRGFAVNLGIGQVLEVELWGIYLGLKIAWDIGCSSAVVLESDSATAVHLLNKNVEHFHPLATMLWGCQDYINKNWVCSIHHVYRECNMVADKVAELSSCLELGLSTFQDPSDSIRSFLSEGLLGVCRP